MKSREIFNAGATKWLFYILRAQLIEVNIFLFIQLLCHKRYTEFQMSKMKKMSNSKDALSHREADFEADKSRLLNFIINISVPFQILVYLAGNIGRRFWNQNNVLLNRLKIIYSIKKRNCNGYSLDKVHFIKNPLKDRLFTYDFETNFLGLCKLEHRIYTKLFNSKSTSIDSEESIFDKETV